MNVLPFVVALLTGLVLVPVSIRLAPHAGLVVRPREDRWGARAIPMFGGLGVTGGILAGLVAGVIVGAVAPVDALVVAAGIAVLFGIGLADDRGEVSPGVRLAIEAGVGAVTAFVIAHDQPLPVQLLATLVALVAVPLAVNATNMVDNADGLAASLSTVTALTLAAATVVLAVAGRERGPARGRRRDGRVPPVQPTARTDVHGRRGKPSPRGCARRPPRSCSWMPGSPRARRPPSPRCVSSCSRGRPRRRTWRSS